MESGPSRPTIIAWAVTAWRDALAAASAMPVVLGIAMVAVLTLNALALPFIPRDVETPTGAGTQAVTFAVGLAQGFLLTPLAIAVHRFVLLGERAGSYQLEPSEPRFRRFFLFTIVLQLLLDIPGALMGLAGKMSGLAAGVSGLAVFVLFVIAAILALRTLILFPAIAVDAPGAEWSNALRDSKGHSWRVLFILIAASVPIFVVYLPVFFLFWWPSGPTGVGTVVLVVVEAVWIVFATAAYAALASRLFMALAERLARPPDAPSASLA